MNTKVRWVLVIPAAVGGFVAVFVGVMVLMFIKTVFLPHENGTVEIGWSPLWLLLAMIAPWIFKLLTGVLGAYCFVKAGCAVAPSRKFITAVVLTAAICSFIIWGDLTAIREYSPAAEYPVAVIYVDLALAIAATIFVCVQEYRKEQEERLYFSSDAGPARYVASVPGSIYHSSDCPHAQRISPDNLTSFGSEADAEAAGYRPCSMCNP